jgi:uncharacterized delta-60 repeat protein
MARLTLPRVATVAAVSLCVLLAAPPAFAAPGDLDTSFGTGGRTHTPIGNFSLGSSVALQGHDIVVAGSSTSGSVDRAVLVRYTPDGHLDPSFGSNGHVTTLVGACSPATSVAVQPADERIVVAAYSYVSGCDGDSFMTVLRYTKNGALDTSFGGGDGIVRFRVGGHRSAANALVLDGTKIVVAGWTDNGSSLDFAVARLDADGALDPSFGGGTGRVETSFGSRDDVAEAIALQPNGKVVVAGLFTGPSHEAFGIARYDTDGSLDASFSGNGKAAVSFGQQLTYTYAVARQSSGKMVLGGFEGGADANLALARLRTDGTLDPTFGSNGKQTTSILSGADAIFGLAIQKDDKVVAAGEASSGFGSSRIVVARYGVGGNVDTSFGGGDGHVTTTFSGEPLARGSAIVLQRDGRILVAGSEGTPRVSSQIAVVRYLAS